MNGYERRRQERLQAQAARREKEREETFISTSNLISAYEREFNALYGYPAKIYSKKGWIYVNGKNVRRDRLIEMTRQLQARLHQQELNIPEQSL